MAENQLTRSDQIERKIDKTTTGSMVAHAPGGAGRFVPQDMNQALEFAKLMAISGKAVRKHLRDQPGTCLAVAMQATEWQMNPFAVANKTYEVNDQLAFEAQLVNAVINTRAPLQKRLRVSYTGEGNALKCKVSGLLIGEDEPFEYESPPFVNITPKNSPVWQSDPRRQIAYYSTRNWARLHCPEIILGVVTDDEMEDARRANNARDITPNPDQLPPPRPTADNRGDEQEHIRIQAEIKADLPKDYVVVAHTGEIVEENIGPRRFIELMWQSIKNASALTAQEFDTFAENNAACIALLHEHNFMEAAVDLAHDIRSHLDKLTAAAPPPTSPQQPSPPQVDQQDVPAGAEIQPAGEVLEHEEADDAAEPETVTSEAEKDAIADPDKTPVYGPDGKYKGFYAATSKAAGFPDSSTVVLSAEGAAAMATVIPIPNDAAQPATETESSGPGIEESSAGSGPKEPPVEFVYKDTAGRSRYFSDPKAWGSFVLKGVNHSKVTRESLDKVVIGNKELFDDMQMWGGDYADQAKIVADAIEKRKTELA